MQLQELLSVAQGGTLRVAKLFLKENPDIMQTYVSTGVTAIGLVLNPLNAFMKHLLVVQGIDPNSVPGEKARQAFLDSLTDSIPEHHARDFDDDYEFGAFHQSLLKTREKLAKLGLTKDKFRQLTDLTKMPGGFKNKYSPFLIDHAETVDCEDDFFSRTTELNRVAPELPKKELPLDKAGRQALREKVLREVADLIKKEGKSKSFDPIVDLKNALVTIRDAVGIEDDKDHKSVAKSANKKPLKVAKKTLNKNPKFTDQHLYPSTRITSKVKVATPDPKFKGSFWRVNEEAE
jgi:hypothetical protein